MCQLASMSHMFWFIKSSSQRQRGFAGVVSAGGQGGNALEMVMRIWTERQIELRGVYEINLTSTALAALLASGHPALAEAKARPFLPPSSLLLMQRCSFGSMLTLTQANIKCKLPSRGVHRSIYAVQEASSRCMGSLLGPPCGCDSWRVAAASHCSKRLVNHARIEIVAL